MKKLVSLILAIMMIAMVGAAVADGASLTMHDAADTTNNEVVRIHKEITAYNPDESTVNAPTATYTYSIDQGTANVSITDSSNVQVVTKAGVTTGVTMTSQTNNTAAATTTLTYSPSETMSTAAAGASNTKWIDIDFSNVVFGTPGVYRYTLTETATTYNGSNGIVYAGSNSGTNTRYLDVYVRASSTYSTGTAASEFDVYGFALVTADSTAITSSNEATVYKTTGFVSDSTQSTPVVADSYYTFNVTISKTVTNDNYTQTLHTKFPFTVAFTNETVTGNVLPIVSANNSSYATTGTALTAGNINSITAHNPTIGHEGSVTYTGIPSGTSITVYETNPVTGATYSVTTTGADTNLSAVTLTNTGNSGNAVANAQAVGTTNVDKTIAFTNNQLEISPTGYVSRFAPYALILVAGIVLLVVAKKRKPAKDDEE